MASLPSSSLPGPRPDPPAPPISAAVDAVRALVRAARVLERACEGLSLAHYRVLAAVAGGDERASRVAARLAVGKPTISAAVESLCGRGLLARFEVESDQRAVRLRLTDEGTALLGRAEAAMAARLEDVIGESADQNAVTTALVELGVFIDAWRERQR
jgi:DNA-binding MarR family transcriptional regulator